MKISSWKLAKVSMIESENLQATWENQPATKKLARTVLIRKKNYNSYNMHNEVLGHKPSDKNHRQKAPKTSSR